MYYVLLYYVLSGSDVDIVYVASDMRSFDKNGTGSKQRND